MNGLASSSARLPDGTEVSVSAVPQEWWDVHDGSGYVPPGLIAPDPNQPRQHIGQTELDELYGSIETKGVRDPITVTPRHLAPWVIVAPEHEHCPFVAVSGHRRRQCALKAKLEAVPIRVRVYTSKDDHYDDAALLNDNRADLTPLEEGLDFKRRRATASVEHLAKISGKTVRYVYLRMNLAELDPLIQAKLDPKLPEKKRLPTLVATSLGGIKAPSLRELEDLHTLFEEHAGRNRDWVGEPSDELDEDGRRFMLQRLLLSVIEDRRMRGTRAIALIREQTLTLAARKASRGNPGRRFRPNKRREIFQNFVREIVSTVVMDWPKGELDRMFEHVSREDLDALLKQTRTAEEFLTSIRAVLTEIRDSKKPTLSVVSGVAQPQSKVA